jgi:hypothetical protein
MQRVHIHEIRALVENLALDEQTCVQSQAWIAEIIVFFLFCTACTDLYRLS